jgi:hypothetical protein
MTEISPPLVALAVACLVGIWAGRRATRGYFDLLSPMCALYLFHGVARAVVVLENPAWTRLHWIVAATTGVELGSALWLMTGCVVTMSVGYLVARQFVLARSGARRSEATHSELGNGNGESDLAAGSRTIAIRLIAVGGVARFVIVAAGTSGLILPEWMSTPLETLGWAMLAGLFVLARSVPSRLRWTEKAGVLWLPTALTLLSAPNSGWSREALLQPVVVVVAGLFFRPGVPVRRVAAALVVVVLPVLVLGHALKRYQAPEATSGERLGAVRESVDEYGSATDLAFAAVLERLHGLDSLLVCRYWVPERRPFEAGNVWLDVVTSAFVPRVIYPEKQVGWAGRFAREFWGTESAGVGISHIGQFYVFGGDVSALVGMGILGALLGAFAAISELRGDVLSMGLFVLVALTVLQIDRDLDGTLGGIGKLVVLAEGARYVLAGRQGRRFAPAPTRLGVPL